MRYISIFKLNNHEMSACVFDGQVAARNYIGDMLDVAGFETSQKDLTADIWDFRNGNSRIGFRLRKVDEDNLSFWLRSLMDGQRTETRKFKSREHAILHVNKIVDSLGFSVDADEDDAGHWVVDDEDSNHHYEFKLSVVVENITRDKQACETLGVSENSSLDEIKTAYRVRVKSTHPDIGGSEEEIKRLNAAYELLMKDEGYATKDNYPSSSVQFVSSILATTAYVTQNETQNTNTTSFIPESDTSALRKWPHWLRWALAWPAGIVGSLLIAWVLRLLWSIGFHNNEYTWLLDLSQAAIIGFLWVYIPSKFAPTAKKIVAVISMCVLIGLVFLLVGFAVFAQLMGVQYENPVLMYVSLASYIVGSVIAVFSEDTIA